MSSTSNTSSATEYWVAAGDVEVDKKENLNPRRATEANYRLPKREALPENTYESLLAALREALEQAFDYPGSCAPFIPAYKSRDDAVSRAKLLRDHGRDSSKIILVDPRRPELAYYRSFQNYAGIVSYHGPALSSSTSDVYLIWETLTKDHKKREEPV
ncbi:hypothetical protein IWW34DRAFT_729274 [Fusarium oxysporum f. sp. albedinis]|nr:hypothetical protein FOMA001_g9221 [Fusarium oxysporum f. sp. matthiolae]KAI3583975.1 hypothetical protein IWW34DRAFT_729274 [Fusarium oxysporum f. sp. albedinis]KAJ0142021.1 Uncharacterized protein HZ326_15143 [Fusarium oxysporum f. sp. albedinis]KAK2477374.1 hypothetical protein H9L39_09862 [Fusarium oxysporum f. sp. albedinis]